MPALPTDAPGLSGYASRADLVAATSRAAR